MTLIKVAPPLDQDVDRTKTYDAVIVGSALVSAVENGLGAVRSLTDELAEGVRSATVAS